MSSCSEMPSSFWIRPSRLHASLMFLVAHAARSISFTSTSMPAKRTASSGSSRFTSSEPMKRGSRYDHVRWISCTNMYTSETLASPFCHPMTSSSNCARKREAMKPCTMSWSASRASKSSSWIASSGTSVFWYICARNSIACHRLVRSASWISIFSSLLAWSQISSTSVTNSCRLSDSRPPSRRSGSLCGGTNVLCVAFMSMSQWRGRIALEPNIWISGIVFWKSLQFLSMVL
mmetsp:Transcript_4419/g.9322  ORF Transcript_4419/g.9322 Transcript_4419/m.9322 type:complete len:233 (-) Transcript_4419:2576-3274(-)